MKIAKGRKVLIAMAVLLEASKDPELADHIRRLAQVLKPYDTIDIEEFVERVKRLQPSAA